MFGIGSFEFLVILAVCLVVLGPEKLPGIMRGFARFTAKFRTMKTEFQRAMNLELSYQEEQERKARAKSVAEGKEKKASSGQSPGQSPGRAAGKSKRAGTGKPETVTPEGTGTAALSEAARAPEADAVAGPPAPDPAQDPASEPGGKGGSV